MIQIRSNVFETNSSSTHSICIPKKVNKIDNFIDFNIGEYGWENDCVEDTASYLYTAILSGYEYDEAMDKVKELADILNRRDIAYRFDKPEWYVYSDGYKGLENGYIDHAYETREFVESILNDEDMLLRYLSDGIVYTGNDNQDSQPDGCDIADDYYYDYDSNEYVPNPYHDEEKYDYFYKGNQKGYMQ